MKRIYHVIEHRGDEHNKVEYLVNASNPAEAIRIVSMPRFTAEVADQQTLIALTKREIEVLDL